MKLQALFDSFRALPPIPRVVQAALAQPIEDRELAQLIAADQAISARLLRVANSASYQMPQQISSISQAMQLLGQVNVRTLVISLGLISGFRQLPAALLQPLWQANLHTAALARQGAPAAGVDAELAYTLGLLQGMGQMLLCVTQPDGWLPPTPQTNPLAPERLARERQLLGYSHADVSAELARRWQFPSALVQVLQALGEPLTNLPEDLARLTALTQVAAWQAWATTQGALSPAAQAAWPADAAQTLKLPEDAAQREISSLPSLCPALHELING